MATGYVKDCEVQIGAYQHDDGVMLFITETAIAAMSPDQARELARQLLKVADGVEGIIR